MKSCSPQALSCILLVCVMLSICQQRFLFNVFLRFFFMKNAFFNVFYSLGQRFLHLWTLACLTIVLQPCILRSAANSKIDISKRHYHRLPASARFAMWLFHSFIYSRLIIHLSTGCLSILMDWPSECWSYYNLTLMCHWLMLTWLWLGFGCHRLLPCYVDTLEVMLFDLAFDATFAPTYFSGRSRRWRQRSSR